YDVPRTADADPRATASRHAVPRRDGGPRSDAPGFRSRRYPAGCAARQGPAPDGDALRAVVPSACAAWRAWPAVLRGRRCGRTARRGRPRTPSSVAPPPRTFRSSEHATHRVLSPAPPAPACAVGATRNGDQRQGPVSGAVADVVRGWRPADRVGRGRSDVETDSCAGLRAPPPGAARGP